MSLCSRRSTAWECICWASAKSSSICSLIGVVVTLGLLHLSESILPPRFWRRDRGVSLCSNGKQVCVSILTRSVGRVQHLCIDSIVEPLIVSILTRPVGRVQLMVLGLVVFGISTYTPRFGAVLSWFVFRAGWVLLCCSACGVLGAVVLAGLAGPSLYGVLLYSPTVVYCWQVFSLGIWVTAGVLLVLGGCVAGLCRTFY